MKKSFVVLLELLIGAICLFSQISFYDELELTRISSNVNGSAYNGNSILVYGDGGVILRSENRGTSWEQINLNDSLNILEVANIGASYYGISNRKYIIYSLDDGKTWQLKDFGNTSFFRIFAYNDKLYALLDGKIWVFDQNLSKIKEYSFTTDSSYFDAVLLGNKLVYSQGRGRLGVINLDNDQTETISLEAYGLCSDCPVPIQLFSNRSSTVYFLLGKDKNLYLYDLKLNDARIVFTPQKLTNAPFYASGDSLFQIYSAKLSNHNVDSIFFGSVNKKDKKFIKIRQPENDRYIVGTVVTHLNFISKDTIIAVGKDKLIYMSFDGGIHWELKSHLNEFSIFFLFDRLKARIIAPYARFIHTNDGGVTWLPQKNYSPVFSENSSFAGGITSARYFIDSDKGFFFGSSSSEPQYPNFIYTSDGGETVQLEKIKNLQHSSFEVFPFIITCYGKTILVTQRKPVFQLPSYLIFDWFDNELKIEKRSFITDTMFYAVFNRNDTLYAIGRDTKDSITNRFYLYYSVDTAQTWIEDFSMRIDTLINDSPFTAQTIGSASMIDDKIFWFHMFHKLVNQKDVLSDKMYIVSVKSKTINKVFTVEEPSLLLWKVLHINNLYNFSWFNFENEVPDLTYAESINENPVVIRKYSSRRYGPPNFMLTEDRFLPPTGILSDTLFAFAAYDSLFRTNALFYARVKKATSAEEAIQIENASPIYITEPSPQPARTISRMKIYHDSRLNIEQADFSAYDLMGMKVAGKESFSLNLLNHYSAELVWEIEEIPPGPYFVIVRIGNESRSTVVVVE